MNRLERLINLVAALLEADRPLTAEELQERVPGYGGEPASVRRAFERDKETLREMGVPVSVEPADPSRPGVAGYRIRKEEYYLRDPGLANDELAALHLAASAVRLDEASGLQALWKLGGAVAASGPRPAVAALPSARHLGTLFACISQRRPVRFSYRGRERAVDPYRLSFRNGHWYLAGREHDRDDDRWYRLDRFESDVSPSPTAGSFDPRPPGPPPAPWQLGSGEPVVARLWVDAQQAGWASSHVGPDSVEERRDDGSVVLAVPVTNREAFRTFVLGFLDHAEVLGPPELRAELIGWLEALAGSEEERAAITEAGARS